MAEFCECTDCAQIAKDALNALPIRHEERSPERALQETRPVAGEDESGPVPDVSGARPIRVSSVTSPDGAITYRASIGTRVVGEMRVTVIPLVHDLTIEPGMLQRTIADALFQYASGYVKASGFKEALVTVAEANAPMQRYVEARAVPEAAAKTYVMGVE